MFGGDWRYAPQWPASGGHTLARATPENVIIDSDCVLHAIAKRSKIWYCPNNNLSRSINRCSIYDPSTYTTGFNMPYKRVTRTSTTKVSPEANSPFSTGRYQ